MKTTTFYLVALHKLTKIGIFIRTANLFCIFLFSSPYKILIFVPTKLNFYFNMTQTLFLIFMGGGIGSLLRYSIQLLLHQRITPFLFPWATLSANIAGSFLIGLFYAWASRFHLSDDARLLLTTGLCGGFTTFSTFSHESLGMLKQGFYGTFCLYVTASIGLSIAAVLLGGWAGK